MAQNKIMINGWSGTPQPDSGLEFAFETTYSSDSTRVVTGPLNFSPLFTVERYSYTRSGIRSADLAALLQNIVGRTFQLTRFSPYYGAWRTDTFYVGQGSLQIGELDDTTGVFDSVSFNMIGVSPI